MTNKNSIENHLKIDSNAKLRVKVLTIFMSSFFIFKNDYFIYLVIIIKKYLLISNSY